ncbi:MAG: VWA domain-containing protein [Acidobacteriota bacterium]
MTKRLSLSGAVFALALTGGAVQAQEPAAPAEAAPQRAPSTFRSSVDVVSVSAVVRDRKGRFVSNMEQKDFIVAEGGRTRPILDFKAQADGPVKLAVLFDISGSMRVGTKAVDAKQAALYLLGALRGNDEAAVFAFDTRLDRVTDFISDVRALEAALEHVEPPFGQTSMYDAIAQTARAVAPDGATGGRLPQRAAVVVLTDGVDTHSRLTPEQVSGIASEIDVPIYIVAVMSPIDNPKESSDSPGPLSNLAHWTGGEYFAVSAPARASVAARQIVEELRHQYVLAFEASAAPGWRPLEVRARDRDLIVRSRAGYMVAGTVGDAAPVR